MAVTTSITIQFTTPGGSATEGSLTAEVDSRPEGYNGGKTSFIPGDSPFILVFKSANVTIDATETSTGSVGQSSDQSKGRTVHVEETLTFVDTLEVGLKYAPSSAPTVSVVSGTVPNARVVGSACICDDATSSAYGNKKYKSLGVVKVTYDATFLLYQLSGVPATLSGLTDFPVCVFIAGSVTA